MKQKSSKAINSRNKGKEGERELARRLTQLGHPSHRGNQYKGSPDSPDVVGLDGIHIECKRVENLSINNAMQQSIQDAGENVPVVIHRTNRAEWKVTMLLDDWILFYEAWAKNDSETSGSTTEADLLSQEGDQGKGEDA